MLSDEGRVSDSVLTTAIDLKRTVGTRVEL